MRIRLVLFVVLALLALSVKGQEDKSFLHPPQIVPEPDNYYRYVEANRKFTGIPSIAVASGGRLWATWYAGPTANEDNNNYVVLSTSSDNGKTWEEILVVDPDGKGPVRTFDPEIWLAPDNTLWLFWAQTIGHDGSIAGVWYIKTDNPEKRKPEWTSPRRITDGVMMCKPTVLSGGEWMLPVSTWRQTDESAKVFVSADHGKSWKLRGACNIPKEDRVFDEHMIVERKNGSLWMVVRTMYGIGESISKDNGKTWSTLTPASVKHTSSRFFICRLASGNLLLVKNGPIDFGSGRSHMMAFISKDDGSTWSKGLLLDERDAVSYPDGQQDENGIIYLIYDRNRYSDQEILMVSFSEEDILSEDYDSRIVKVTRNRKVVSKGGK